MKIKEKIYIALVIALGFLLLTAFVADQFSLSFGWFDAVSHSITSPVALGVGVIFALFFGKVFPNFNKLMSKRMLQYSVIGLGFGMNVEKALQSGSEGMLFTIVSVFGTLALGWFFGRKLLKVDSQTSYLISSGTAICGGSAIAAVGPIVNAKSENMSVALGVVFVLNAIALFIFPSIGTALGMSMKEFGMWAAIAIHDTSSVVGAGAAYDHLHPDWLAQQGVSALEVATTIKLTRALWIVVLALITPFFFKQSLAQVSGVRKPWYQSVPRFIVWFVVVILFNSYILSNTAFIGEQAAHVCTMVGAGINSLAKHFITLSLFFIGASLTRDTLKQVGLRPFVMGVLLWISVSVISLAVIMG